LVEKQKEIVLLGPTAVGKTKVSVIVAQVLGAEIVSADSRLVYKELDIGTAKPTMEERGGVPHHLIDVVDIWSEFTVADFQKLAFKALDDIHSRGRKALVVGGTGLYLRALVDLPSYQNVPPMPDLRREIMKEIQEYGSLALYEELKRFDPSAASKIHPNNIPRLVRAVEVVRATGRRFSEVIEHDRRRKAESPYNWLLIGLTMDRGKLYDRINRRVKEMVQRGWVDEVRALIAKGATGEEKPLKGLGYKDIIAYLVGKQSLDEAVEKIQRDTRRFAKRQMTFFRMINDVKWIEVDYSEAPQDVARKVISLIESS